MEGSSDSNKRKGDDVQDGTRDDKKLQRVTTEMEFFNCSICSNTLRPPIYQLPFEHDGTMLSYICENCRSKLRESERAATQHCKFMERKVRNAFVANGVEIFDCSICSKPLVPPIFESPEGNSICSSCCDNLPETEHDDAERCYIMERVVNRIFVPCKYGCNGMHRYNMKDEHAKGCMLGPCVCPVSSCGFIAPATVLLEHLTTLHKLPKTPIEFFVPSKLQVQAGSQLLCSKFNCLFLVDIVSLESFGHAIYLVCVRPETPLHTVQVNVQFSPSGQHLQVSMLQITPEDEPRQYLCSMPFGEHGATISIELHMVYIRNLDVDEELFEKEEEDEEDEDYQDDD